MQNEKLEVKGGRLVYERGRGKVTITGLEGNMVRLTVPEQIEGMPVTEVYKKAFFNCRYLRCLTLPDTLEKIDNWAFAHCQQLERVELPWRRMSLGKDLFIGSERLRKIVLRPVEETAGLMTGAAGGGPEAGGCVLCNGAEISRLLAVAATKMEDPHLFCIEEAGTQEWLKRWDARMLVLMHEDDNDGYDKQVLAGEEDYERTDQVRFRNLKRQAKVRLALLRLLNPCGLPPETQKELEEYLRAHTKGCRFEETWEVVCKEYGDDQEYYELFAALGCVTEDNFDGILQDIGEEHTEMKAYLMRYKEQHLGHRDFFDGLSLDF
ncbi:MAG: leucine-rich repeat protein [Eubacteriales bacterium]|nr:leucine-rich repeat protein [Eubacteriales bacterium]